MNGSTSDIKASKAVLRNERKFDMKNDDKCPYCKGDVYAAGCVAVCKSCGKILPSRTVIGKPMGNTVAKDVAR